MRVNSCISEITKSSSNTEFYDDSFEDELFIMKPNNEIKTKKVKKIIEDLTDDESTISGDFDFNDPTESDYHSIKNILVRTQYNLIKNLNFHEFVDIICNQGNIGTTVSISDNIVGFSTIVNFRQYRLVMSEIASFIQDKIGKSNEDFKQLLDSIIYEKNVGLIINERIPNIPHEIAPVLCNCLKDDIQWTLDNIEDFPLEEREFYNWDYIVLFTTRYVSTKDHELIQYNKYEEERILDNSLHKFVWRGEKKQWFGSGNKNDTLLMRQEFVIAISDYETFKKCYFC
ncbi:hypothetical protein FG386_000469 [Cryptosporidium ryanae]|uniref:uncharacterized protein n=1 Tax=Cryptosporidium ryanae TaxID=515981 RepID=UPI00351A30F0|nr:hypothetical protein FG386_000469 [Cryptosporidium ryanae]